MQSAENVGVYYAGQKTWLQLVCCALAAGTRCLLFWNTRARESGEAEKRRYGKTEERKCGDDILKTDLQGNV